MLILCEEDLTKVEDLPDENYFYRFGLVDKYEGIYENFDFFYSEAFDGFPLQKLEQQRMHSIMEIIHRAKSNSLRHY